MSKFSNWARTLFGLEKRAVYPWNVFGDQDLPGTKTKSGATVSEHVALKYSVVYAAVTLIADGVSGLPPAAFQEMDDGSREPGVLPTWVRKPHPEMRRFDVWNQLLIGVLLSGNGLAQFVRRQSDGVIIGMNVLDPSTVDIEWDPARPGYRRYRINGSGTASGTSNGITSHGTWLTSYDIFHIQGPTLPGKPKGLSVIASAREAIGLGITLEEFGARYFAQGSQAKIILELPGTVPDDNKAKAIVRIFERFHRGKDNWHRPAIASGGAKIHNVTIPPEDAQFLQTREFQAIDVARWFRVPPHRVGIVSASTSWGSGLAEENMAMLQHTYRPWIVRFQGALTDYAPGNGDSGTIIELLTDALLQGTFKDLAEIYDKLYIDGMVTKNEARKKLGLSKVEGGDEFAQPAAPAGQPADPRTKEQDRIRKQEEAKRHLAGQHNQNTHAGKHTKAHLSDGKANELAERLQTPDGGFTIDPRTGKDVTKGFAVAAYKSRSKEVPAAEVSGDTLQSYVDANADLLSEPGNMLGGWHDPETGQAWLDISKVTDDKDEAITLAKMTNQIAIFDLSNFESISTGGTGRSAYGQLFKRINVHHDPHSGKFASHGGSGAGTGGMHAATAEDKKAYKLKTGQSIPPAWTEVEIADDLDSSALLVRGKDAKGRVQSRYSAEHTKAQAAKKFARNKELVKHTDKLDSALERDAMDDDDAGSLLLIRKMGLRPGSDRDTGAKVQAHGATNLKAKHVKVNEDGSTSLDFIGKEGVHIQLKVHDDLVTNVLHKRLQKKSGEDRLFDTNEDRVTNYMRTTGGIPREFLVKDLRTLHANTVALRVMQTMAPPKTKREFLSQRKRVAEAVSSQLGNTPTLALSSYINPAVFDGWIQDESWVN